MTIELNGSHGEGGGQIARTAVGMACALGEKVIISDIRKGRARPGLRSQHLAGIRLAAEMCDAEVSDIEVGSDRIELNPRSNTGGEFEIDVGTAGSISLVLQTCLIPAVLAKGPVKLVVRGGTDVPMAPPIDYFELVIFPLLRRMGVEIEMTVVERGFYPSGGGEVQVDVAPAGRLSGIDLASRGRPVNVSGSIASRNLPDHVSSRVRDSASKHLSGLAAPAWKLDGGRGPSTGVSLVLVAEFENTVIGSTCLGEKGLPAEKVGEIAATDLKSTLSSDATLDEHASDQIIPFAFLAAGHTRFKAPNLSKHSETNLWVARQFVDRKVESRNEGKGVLVIIE